MPYVNMNPPQVYTCSPSWNLPSSCSFSASLPPTTVLVVQSLSCVQLFVTLWTAARQAPLSFSISRSLLKCMSIELVMQSSHLILCHPLLSFCSCTCSWGLGLVLDRKISLPHWDWWVCFEFPRGVWEDISWKMGSFVLQIQKILAEDNVVGKNHL